MSALGAVVAHSGEHDRDGALAIDSSHRLEEDIGGRAHILHPWRLCEVNRMGAANQNMPVWWRNIYFSPAQALTGRCPDNRKRTPPAQKFREMARVARREMLYDQNRYGKVRW